MSMVLAHPLSPAAHGDPPDSGTGRRRWEVWRSRPAAALGAPRPARHRRPRGAPLCLEHHRRRARAVLLGGRQEHVRKLEGVLLRRVRPPGDDHVDKLAGSFRRRLCQRASSASTPGRWPCRRSSRVSSGSRPVPGRPALGRRDAGPAGGRPVRAHADRRVHVRAQHGGRRAHHVPGTGVRCLPAGGHRGAAAVTHLGRGLCGAQLPGENAAGLDDPARAGHRLPARRADPAAPARVAAGRGRCGHAGRVAVLDRALHVHPGPRPAIRGRVDHLQRGRDGLRLQGLERFGITIAGAVVRPGCDQFGRQPYRRRGGRRAADRDVARRTQRDRRTQRAGWTGQAPGNRLPCGTGPGETAPGGTAPGQTRRARASGQIAPG